MALLHSLAVASAWLSWHLLPSYADRLQHEQQQDRVISKVADASHGFDCPDAFSCIAAPCKVEHSNGKPGLDCRCKDGYTGTVTWSGPVASGDCQPARCNVENSNQEPGPACRCKDGFEGELSWSGPQVEGDCLAAPCSVEHSNGEPGLACQCGEGFEGEITWSGPRPVGECRPTRCDVENSNHEPGLACKCLDGFTGEITWKDGIVSGECRPARCNVRFSDHKPGLQCSCKDSSIGTVRWVGDKALGPCTPAPCSVPNSNRLAGKACACDNYSEGPPMRWKAGRAHGQCKDTPVEVIHLFDPKKSVMRHNGKEFKCCVSSQSGTSTRIVSLSDDLKLARKYGDRHGCGRLLGDTWHGAHRSKSCKVTLGEMAGVMQISRDDLIRLVSGEGSPEKRMAKDLINPGVVATNAKYTFFQEDMDHYDERFGPYLPSLKSQEYADDLVLFLPVSYHTNPANFEDLMTKKYYIEDDDGGWNERAVCSATDLDYYQDGPTPEYQFCGYAGRKKDYDCPCDDNPDCGIAEEYQDCKAWCYADIREAFGPVDRTDLENPPSAAQVSFYFTWYSKTQNQPMLTGYWTNPFLSHMPSECSASPGLCDPTCQDSGGPLETGFQKGDAFGGCIAERACGQFATCTLGSAVISQSWADERPRQYDGDQAACESHGYYYRSSDGFCKYDSNGLDCETGRCFDRGHLVPSGVAGWHYGRSGQTFTMCNIGAQTSSLNECKWQWLEKVVACTGQYYSMLSFAGAMGPFQPSQRMTNVTRPAAFFKVVFLPRQSGLPGDAAWDHDTVFVWILENDEEKTYDAASYRGREGLEAIEQELGLQFPPAIQAADFPKDCSMFWTLLSQDGRMEACDFSEDAETSGSTGPYYLLQACAGKTDLKVPMCPYFGDSVSRTSSAPSDDLSSGWRVDWR